MVPIPTLCSLWESFLSLEDKDAVGEKAEKDLGKRI